MNPARPLDLLDSAVELTREKDRRALRLSLVHALEEVLGGGAVSIVSAEDPPETGPDRDQWQRLPLYDRSGGVDHLAVRMPADAHEALHITRAFLRLYQNFLEVIDDSERDRLTQLQNRRAFDHQLERLIQSLGARQPMPVADREAWLALVDVDHFKRINDRFGHVYGDEVLILVAQLMRQHFRADDACFRYGGEEFAVMLRGCRREAAAAALERFRTKVAEHRFPRVGQVTISIGFCALQPGLPPPVAVERADRALYFAKSEGRNRIADHEALSGGQNSETTRSIGHIELF